MENHRSTAKSFWNTSEEYPAYDNIRERRFHELKYLVPKIHNGKPESLVDVGCGTGDLIQCLRMTTSIQTYYALDFSEKMLHNLSECPNVITRNYDLYNLLPLPEADVAICAGALNFIFDDETMEKAVQLFQHFPIVYFRIIATNEKNEVVVNKHSDHLQAEYACRYPTLSYWISLFTRNFSEANFDRVYPDDLESKFKTKQYYFTCKP